MSELKQCIRRRVLTYTKSTSHIYGNYGGVLNFTVLGEGDGRAYILPVCSDLAMLIRFLVGNSFSRLTLA